MRLLISRSGARASLGELFIFIDVSLCVYGLVKASNYLSCMRMHRGCGKAYRIVLLRTVNPHLVWSAHEAAMSMRTVEASKRNGSGANAGTPVARGVFIAAPSSVKYWHAILEFQLD